MFGDFLFPLGSLIRLSVQGRPLSGPQCLTRSSSIMGSQYAELCVLVSWAQRWWESPVERTRIPFPFYTVWLYHICQVSRVPSLLFSQMSSRYPLGLLHSCHLEPCFLVDSFFSLGICEKHFFSPCRSENVYPRIHWTRMKTFRCLMESSASGIQHCWWEGWCQPDLNPFLVMAF